MTNKYYNSICLILMSFALLGFTEGDTLKVNVKGLTLEGTLLKPGKNEQVPIVLFISGSGPTDRDGNQKTLQNNSLKYLAEGLQKNGIASLRYDKRSCYPEYINNVKEEDISFDDFVDDAVAWIEHLEGDDRFNEILVIGHSQGSLVGILAAQRVNVSKIISLCGPGKPLGASLKRQLESQGLKEIDKVEAVINSLEMGKTTEDFPPYLSSLFRLSVQPFLISWLKYNPGEEAKKLNIPILVVHGTSDSQISEDESQAMADANETQMISLEGMNHVLKNVGDNFFDNRKSYTNPDLPLHEDLVEEIVRFIKN